MTENCRKPVDYKSGALPTELSRRTIVLRSNAPFAPILAWVARQGRTEQSGKVRHIVAQFWHNTCHTTPHAGRLA